MLTTAFSKSRAKPFPVWGTSGFLVDLSDLYDEEYQPKKRPKYVINDDNLYDPVSGLYIPLEKLLFSRVDPTDKNFTLSAMDIALIKGDNVAVIAMADNLLAENSKNTYAMCIKATALSLEGNAAAAIELNTCALQIDPKNPALLNNRAIDLLATGRAEEALVDIKKSIEYDNGDFLPSYGVLFRTLVHLGRTDEALTALETRLKSKKEGVLPPLQLKMLAGYMGCDDPAEALEKINRFRNDKVNNPGAPRNN